MFHPRYAKYIQSFLLVLPMTGIVTGINTFIARGFHAVFTVPTFHRWMISLLVAFPCVQIMLPLAAKLTKRLVKSD